MSNRGIFNLDSPNVTVACFYLIKQFIAKGGYFLNPFYFALVQHRSWVWVIIEHCCFCSCLLLFFSQFEHFLSHLCSMGAGVPCLAQHHYHGNECADIVIVFLKRKNVAVEMQRGALQNVFPSPVFNSWKICKLLYYSATIAPCSFEIWTDKNK